MNLTQIGSLLLSAAILLSACATKNALEGKWEFSGGIYNGKKEGGTEGYKLQRNYKGNQFEAYMIEDESQPQKFQAGSIKLDGDSCLETETFSAQPSKLTGVTLRYAYQIKNDTLVLKGTLPTGMEAEEYWKKLK